MHRFQDNHSYVMPGTSGNYDLVAGDAFQMGILADQYHPYLRADVVSIDDTSLTATLRLEFRPAVPPPFNEVVGRIIGGVASDGGGAIIIGGQVHPIPPWGPELQIVQQLINYGSVRNLGDVGLRLQVQQSALAAIGNVISVRANELQPLRSPAARLGPGEKP